LVRIVYPYVPIVKKLRMSITNGKYWSYISKIIQKRNLAMEFALNV